MTGRRAPRDSYSTVGEATRDMIERALSGPLTLTEAKVVLGIVHFVSSYSKLSDTVSRSQMAELLSGDERTIRRAVKALAERGVFDHTPGCSQKGGRRSAARFGLPTGGRGTPGHTTPGRGTRGSTDPRPGGVGPPNRGAWDPPSEELSEKLSEEGGVDVTKNDRLNRFAKHITAPTKKLDPDETANCLAELDTAFGAHAVDDALAQLAPDARWRWPRDLADAIRQDLAPHEPKGFQAIRDALLPDPVPQYADAYELPQPKCERCKGTGWATVDEYSIEVVHCPECRKSA